MSSWIILKSIFKKKGGDVRELDWSSAGWETISFLITTLFHGVQFVLCVCVCVSVCVCFVSGERGGGWAAGLLHEEIVQKEQLM